MREIKFRGKRKANGEWVYGAYFCLHHNDERVHVHHFIIPENTPIPKEKPIGEIQVEVIPETVGQLTTGLKDKDGVEIYEGDIVKITDLYAVESYGKDNELMKAYTRNWVVIWQEVGFKIKFHNDKYGYPNDIICDFPTEGVEIEVIGNIYDNPELMKGEKK